MNLTERLKANLIFVDSPEAKKEAVGVMCIPFKNEDAAGAEELFQAIKNLVENL